MFLSTADIVIILVLVALIVGAVVHIIRAKKKGGSCAGCPMSGNCSKTGDCGRY